MARPNCRWCVVALVLAVFTLGAASSFVMAAERKVSITKVPAKVKSAILKEVGKGKLVDIGEITDGQTTRYEIELILDDKEFDILFSSDGKVLKKTTEGPKDEKSVAKKTVAKKTVAKKTAAKKTAAKKTAAKKTAAKKTAAKKTAAKKTASKKTANKQTAEKKAVSTKTAGKKEPAKNADGFQDSFDLESRTLSSKGKNKYFILEPDYQLVLEGKEGEHTVKLEILVLDETKKIDGIETRVVVERETTDGELIEISRNFFAICEQTKSVFYFGEEVDMYRDGKIVSHDGAWLHGKNNARAGMMMPGEPALGAAFYQEVAPKVAMDRAKIVDVDVSFKTPAGKFSHCLKVQEEDPLDKGREFKIHAPGIGLIQDENLLLVKHGFIKK